MTNLPAGPTPHSRRNRERETEHRVAVYQLRLSGHSYRSIEAITADPDGPTGGVRISKTRAQLLCELEATEREAPQRAALIEFELDRLDAMLLAVANKAATGDVAAIDRALKIGERRARLLGLDAPTQQVVEATVHEVTQEDIELAALIREAQARVSAEEAKLREATAKAGDTTS